MRLVQPYLQLDAPGITLRQLHPDEAGALFAVVDANRVTLEPWLPWVNQTKTPVDSQMFIESSLRQRGTNRTYGYGIIKDGQIIGHASLMYVTDERPLEIGYWVSHESTGQGVATTVAERLTSFAVEQLGATYITIQADVRNTASNRVASKAGYKLDHSYIRPEDSQTMNVWAYTPTGLP